jgi:hypothetical protein
MLFAQPGGHLKKLRGALPKARRRSIFAKHFKGLAAVYRLPVELVKQFQGLQGVDYDYDSQGAASQIHSGNVAASRC